MTEQPSPEELARREEVRRKMQELLDKRNAIPDADKTPLHRPERFEGPPIGMDDDGNLKSDDAADSGQKPSTPRQRP